MLSFLNGHLYLSREVGKPDGVVGVVVGEGDTVSVAVADGDGDDVSVGVGLDVAPVEYSTCNFGARVADFSNACATTWPVPLIFSAKALPEFQPVRLTTSCTTAEISDVCFFAPTVSHPVGDQETLAEP